MSGLGGGSVGADAGLHVGEGGGLVEVYGEFLLAGGGHVGVASLKPGRVKAPARSIFWVAGQASAAGPVRTMVALVMARAVTNSGVGVRRARPVRMWPL